MILALYGVLFSTITAMADFQALNLSSPVLGICMNNCIQNTVLINIISNRNNLPFTHLREIIGFLKKKKQKSPTTLASKRSIFDLYTSDMAYFQIYLTPPIHNSTADYCGLSALRCA